MEGLKSSLRRIGYVLLAAIVAVRDAWVRITASVRSSWSFSGPSGIGSFFRPFHSFTHRRPPGQRGTTPRPPTILAVLLSEPYNGIQGDQALDRVINWAQLNRFRLVYVYDPAGELQAREPHVASTLHMSNPSGGVLVWAGWHPPPHYLALLDADDSQTQSEKRNILDSAAGQQKLHTVGVALLSAVDAEGPLLFAMQRTPAEHAGVVVVKDGNSGQDNSNLRTTTAIERAIDAPRDVKFRLSEVAGPLVAYEPDLVLVFGPALTMSGFPPWLMRTAELFEVGPLSLVTGSKLDALLRRFLRTRQRFGK